MSRNSTRDNPGRAVSRARNAFIGIEHLTEAEIEELRKKSEARAKNKASGTERSR